MGEDVVDAAVGRRAEEDDKLPPEVLLMLFKVSTYEENERRIPVLLKDVNALDDMFRAADKLEYEKREALRTDVAILV
jgi:hypothetical protein